uniref:Putative secreted protein n=1 Tax=Amblyomma triste TaxID=251400 RepID=A0A023G340_AMBTT
MPEQFQLWSPLLLIMVHAYRWHSHTSSTECNACTRGKGITDLKSLNIPLVIFQINGACTVVLLVNSCSVLLHCPYTQPS